MSRSVRERRAAHEAHPSGADGARLPLSAAHGAHRRSRWRRKTTVEQWDRKFIRTDSGWASPRPGGRAGSPSRITPSCCRKISELKDDAARPAEVRRRQLDRSRSPGNKLRITIRTSRPGIIIGRKGAEIEKLKQDLAKKHQARSFHRYSGSAQAGAGCAAGVRIDRAAARKARGVPPRDAQSRRFGAAFRLQGNQGPRIGPLERRRKSRAANGICRGSFRCTRCAPISTTDSAEAHTTYGVIGVKCWVYKGEILPGGSRAADCATSRSRGAHPRDRRSGSRSRS